jgi:hypothetical protein
LILAETRDGIAEISDLASHLCAIATWPPNWSPQ